VLASPATTFGNDLDDANPQIDAGDEGGEKKAFMKGELRISALSRPRQVNADVILPLVSIHRRLLELGLVHDTDRCRRYIGELTPLVAWLAACDSRSAVGCRR
jgi:hypothetical protein